MMLDCQLPHAQHGCNFNYIQNLNYTLEFTVPVSLAKSQVFIYHLLIECCMYQVIECCMHEASYRVLYVLSYRVLYVQSYRVLYVQSYRVLYVQSYRVLYVPKLVSIYK